MKFFKNVPNNLNEFGFSIANVRIYRSGFDSIMDFKSGINDMMITSPM